MPLSVRGRVILVEQFNPRLVNDIIEREQVSCLPYSPIAGGVLSPSS